MLKQLCEILQTYLFKNEKEISELTKHIDFSASSLLLESLAQNPNINFNTRIYMHHFYNEFKAYIPLSFLVKNPTFDLWLLEGNLNQEFFKDYITEIDEANSAEWLNTVHEKEMSLLAKSIINTENNKFHYFSILGGIMMNITHFISEFHPEFNYDQAISHLKFILNTQSLCSCNYKYSSYNLDSPGINYDFIKFIKLLKEETLK